MEDLKSHYPVNFLCELMNLNRSGYYKWHKRQGNKNFREKRREEIIEKLEEAHKKYPSYGYHRLAKYVRDKLDYYVSDNLVHVCCKSAGIFSKARNPAIPLKGRENVRFPNLIKGKWNVERPLEVVVSDMTIFKAAKKTWQLVLIIDVFNNEIIAHSLTDSVGSNKSYYDCLEKLKNLIKDDPVILHTDQGAVYSSRAFEYAHKDCKIIRSMSRSATPTDNPINEALNGWIKQELYLDFNLADADDVPKLIDDYVQYFNSQRNAYSLNYKTPKLYKKEMGF